MAKFCITLLEVKRSIHDRTTTVSWQLFKAVIITALSLGTNQAELFLRNINIIHQNNNDDEKTYKTPSLARKVGHSLLNVALFLKAQALQNRDTTATKDAEDFSALYQENWRYDIGSQALKQLNLQKWTPSPNSAINRGCYDPALLLSWETKTVLWSPERIVFF